MENNNNTSIVAWIALALSIMAIILAWTAFNRAGQDLEQIVAEQVEEATKELRIEYQQAEDAVLEGTADTLEVGSDVLEGTADTIDTGANNTDNAAGEVRNQQ